MTNEELADAVYELAEAVRRIVVAMQTGLSVPSDAYPPGERREFTFAQIAPVLPEVLEHVEAVKAKLLEGGG